MCALFWEPFAINFRYFFGIEFCMPSWMTCFRFLTENGSQNGPGKLTCEYPFGAQDRSKNASAPQPRYFTDFGSRFGDILRVFGFQNQAIGTPWPHQNVPKTHPQRNLNFLSDLGSISVFCLTVLVYFFARLRASAAFRMTLSIFKWIWHCSFSWYRFSMYFMLIFKPFLSCFRVVSAVFGVFSMISASFCAFLRQHCHCDIVVLVIVAAVVIVTFTINLLKVQDQGP